METSPEYTAIDMEVMDIDLIGVSSAGQVGQFMTGAVCNDLPEAVRTNRPANEANVRWVEQLACVAKCRRMAGLRKHLDSNGRSESFDQIAERGLFAFDAVGVSETGDIEYVCVAAPASEPLLISNCALEMRAVPGVDAVYALGQRVRIQVGSDGA